MTANITIIGEKKSDIIVVPIRTIFSNDDVIKDFYVDDLTGLYQLFCDPDVLCTGRWISGGMVVDQDDC